MFLKRIELLGFKSFANKVVIDLAPGVTAVVGPNGSGKSNLGDALRWVLGETTTRALRATRVEELIFAGSITRKAQGMCEVTVTLDNSHGELPIAYQEVSITRRAFRNGQSEYLLNGTVCRLKDVQDVLAGTGLGQGGYALVGQGEIDAILSARPEERRLYFEEAAGIVRYRRRQAEALERLQRTEESLVRLGDILAEIEAELGPVREQAERAAVFLARQKELDSLQLALYEHDLARLHASLESVTTQVALIDRQTAAIAGDESAVAERLDAANRELEHLERELSGWRRTIAGARQEEERALADLRLGQERLERVAADLSRYANEAAELLERQQSLGEEIQDWEKHRSSWALELGQVEEDLRSALVQLDEEKKAVIAAQQRYEAEKGARQRLEKGLAERRGFLAALEREMAAAEGRLEELARDIAQTMAAQAEAKDDWLRAKEKANRARAQEAELRSFLGPLRAEVKSQVDELDNLQAKLNSVRQELARVGARRQALQELGFRARTETAGMRALLAQAQKASPQIPGVLGLLAELIEVPVAEQSRVEIALGDLGYLVVVQDRRALDEARQFVRENGGGPVMLVALSEVPPCPAWSEAQADWESLATRVRYPPELAALVGWLLGPVLVPRHGAVVGSRRGVSGASGPGLVWLYPDGHIETAWGGQKWPEDKASATGPVAVATEIRNLQLTMAGLEHDLATIQTAWENARGRLASQRARVDELEKELSEVSHALAVLQGAETAAQRTVDQLTAQLQRLQDARAGLVEANKERESRRARLRQEIAQLEEEYGRRQAGLDPLAETLTDLQREWQEKTQAVAGIREKKVLIEAQLARATEESQRVQKELAAINRRLADIDRLTEEAKRHKQEHEALLTQTRARIDQVRQEGQAAEKRLEELTSLQQELVQRRTGLVAEQDAYRHRLSELGNRRHRLETHAARLETELEALVRSLEERYPQAKDDLLQRVRSGTAAEQAFDRAAALARVAELRQEIAGLGTVNVGAIEELRRLEERRRFLSQQLTDMTRSRDDLLSLVSEMQKTMTVQFKENFARIQEAFAELFQEAFRGGRGTVSLTDPADPLHGGVDIMVQPPGKKVQNLAALSGGERAMAGVVLLFSFLRVNPSPFCLLDEVDSSLDEANVQRFLHLVAQFRSRTQFLVMTHNRATMEAADILHGVVMDSDGSSRTVFLRLSAPEAASSGLA